MDGCDECGFSYEDRSPLEVAEALESLGPLFAERLRKVAGSAGGDALLRRRPEPDVWSALEYACHVRDVLLVQRERLYLALVEDCPSFARMNREERVVLARYGKEEPERVAAQLELAAELVAEAFRGVDEEGWRRPCIYNFPAPARRTVGWLGSHTLHEGLHHLGDLDRVLAAG